MPPNLQDLRALKSEARQRFMPWKQGILMRDKIVRSRVPTEWPDQSSQETDIMVRNEYLRALMDKSRTAGGLMPRLEAFPTRGTRNDRGERVAEKRRRVMAGMWHRSGVDINLASYYGDFWHAGAAYTMPWTRWLNVEGRPIPAAQRHVHFERVNPRFVYPLGHDFSGRLTSALIVRVRPLAELEAERGIDHPVLSDIRRRNKDTLATKPFFLVEESWYVDTTHWAVFVSDAPNYEQTTSALRTYAVPGTTMSTNVSWIVEPDKHRLGRCPLTEMKAFTVDEDYGSPLEGVLPNLRVAHQIAAWALEEMSEHIFGWTATRNINTDEIGPGKILEAVDPNEPIEVIHSREPPNFEAWNAVFRKMDDAAEMANQPAQRGGDPGASIVSDKGLHTLQGSYNDELADAQRRLAKMLEHCTENGAAFDEVHCDAEKEVEGIESGADFNEKYLPSSLFAGDYRNIVTFGAKQGLDSQAILLRLSAMANMGALSRRTLIREAGITDDPLQEEREIGMEGMLDIGRGQLAEQMATGNTQAWDAMFEYYRRLDSDTVTDRVALRDAIMTINQIVPGGDSGMVAPSGPGDPGAAVLQDRQLAAGGAPDGQAMLQQLPPSLRRAMSVGTPGGTQ